MNHTPSPRRDRNTAYGVASPELDRLAVLSPSLLAGLVGFWNFNDLKDSVTGTNLVNGGSVNFATDPGKATFNGSNYLETPSTSALQAGDIDFTIVVRAFLVNSNFYGLINKWSSASTDQEYEIISNSGIAFYLSSTNQNVFAFASTTSGLVLNGWNLIIAEHDSVNDQIRIQCNSGAAAVTSWAQGIRVSNVPLTFGAYSANQLNKVPSGTKLDYVGIWKRLLTATEKTQVGLEYPFR